jgi:hypothetical protein
MMLRELLQQLIPELLLEWDTDHFVVPTGVTSFTFTDSGDAYQYDKVGETWVIDFVYLDAFLMLGFKFEDNLLEQKMGLTVTDLNTGFADSKEGFGRALNIHNDGGISRIYTNNFSHTITSEATWMCKIYPTADGGTGPGTVFGHQITWGSEDFMYGFRRDSPLITYFYALIQEQQE